MKTDRPLLPRAAPSKQTVWAGTRPTSEAAANIATILRSIKNKRLFIACWTLCFAVCGAAYTHFKQPDYIARTQILLQPRIIVNDGPEDYRHFHQLSVDSEQCETELRILRSEQLLYRVFKALDLVKSKEVTSGADGFWAFIGSKIDRISRFVSPEHESLQSFNAFINRMRTRRLGLSYVIEISYRSHDAQNAMRVANSIASAFAEYRLRGVITREQRRGVYLEDRQSKLQSQILAAEVGTRLGTIPNDPMIDSGVRLLGPAKLPLGSAYPKAVPMIALMTLFGAITAVLIVVIPNNLPNSQRQAKISTYPTRPRVA